MSRRQCKSHRVQPTDIAKAASGKRALADWHKVDRIYRRQSIQRWGSTYDPAIHAVAGEAPPKATPVAFFSERLGRTMHALSHGEAFFIAVALMNPMVWDLHEQAILHPYPSQHPLAAHPTHGLQPWPATRGTLEILNDWGVFHRHPKVSLSKEPGQIEDRAWPWISDIRLFLIDSQGPYVVDLDVKDRTGAHAMPYAGDAMAAYSKSAHKKANLRERAYQAYNAELNIKTRRVAKDQVSDTALKNLLRIVMRVQSPLNLPASLVSDVEAALVEAAVHGDTPVRAVRRVVSGDRATISALRVMDWAIWQRRLCLDFEHDILVDRPLIRAEVDLVDLHAELFKR